MKSSLSENLKLKITALPNHPGVYLMKDASDNYLYIGKAKNLRTRVRSYFQEKSDDGRQQLKALLQKVVDIDYIVTDTEQEALVLEANQIKSHRPRYNIHLKDDKKYPFIRITSEQFPRIFATRDIVRDGSRYLGPFSDVQAMHTTLELMHKIFPVRSCDFPLPSNKVKLCLEHQIQRCDGPCEGLTHSNEYRRQIDQAVRFLKGDNTSVVKELKAHMEQAASELRFEQAARCRDQLKAMEVMKRKQKVVYDESIDRDVIGLARSDDNACCAVLEIREGRLLGQKHHFLSGIIENSDSEIMSAFVRQFYLQTDFVPREVHLSVVLENKDMIALWLSKKASGRVSLKANQRGIKAKAQEMADGNAAHFLEERRLKRELRQGQVSQSVIALQRDLNLPRPPHRIEGVDISNFQGTDSVGSVVCMVDGKPHRSDYRHFKIKNVNGVDDFASIREVVTRRFRGLLERGEKLPDLLMIDGGKGQLSSAVAALMEMGLCEQPVVGLAKRFEEVFLPNINGSRLLPKTSASLRLLQVLRDEAHRFALSYHRKLRSKRTVTSTLDRIPSIGPKRRTALLRTFGSLQRIIDAEVDQIAKVKGFSPKLAKELKCHLEIALKNSGTS
tara:strand:+ start:615 stop:2462 length:1848 start_codon:yes stop_codon:yes gene_type:complete